jgi:hypothetical protein
MRAQLRPHLDPDQEKHATLGPERAPDEAMDLT